MFLYYGVLGVGVGVLSAFLGIGGGVVLVPALLLFGLDPRNAIAVSSGAIFITSSSATLQNWRKGNVKPDSLLYIAFPSVVAAPVGAWFSSLCSSLVLLSAFSLFLLFVFISLDFRSRLKERDVVGADDEPKRAGQLITGLIAGFCAGFFGIGGGVILVPLQILLAQTPFKSAIRNSLAVIVVTSGASALGHAVVGNLLVFVSVAIGAGGIIGGLLGITLLDKAPERHARVGFKVLISVSFLISVSKAFLAARG